MTTFIALLRGINVSGHKKIKMEELRKMMVDLGFGAVTTYIQSGNIVFEAKISETQILQRKIKQHIEKSFGHEVPVLVLTVKELSLIIERNSNLDVDVIDQNNLYYVLLFNRPDQESMVALRNEKFDGERFMMATDCVYLFCKNGYGRAKLNNNLVERKLKVQATTRNHKTMLKLLEISKTVS